MVTGCITRRFVHREAMLAKEKDGVSECMTNVLGT